MPKTKFQDLIYTVIMVVVMVYAMVLYNVAWDAGLSNAIFFMALRELPAMCAIAFVLEFFLIGRLSRRIVSRRLSPKQTPPVLLTAAISAVIVCFMCPVMSLIASLIFGFTGPDAIVLNWLRIAVRNFPMALCWQIFYAGPFVRFLFRRIFRKSLRREKEAARRTPSEADRSAAAPVSAGTDRED